MKLRQKLHTVEFTLKKSKFTINIFHCWTRWFQCWKNILLCTGQSQKPTIGENWSKYFLLMLTVMLQKLQSSSLSVKFYWSISSQVGLAGNWGWGIRSVYPKYTDSSSTKSAITFALEAEGMAKFHEICKHGVLHYFTIHCCYFWSLLYSHCIYFCYHKDDVLAVKMWYWKKSIM